MNEKKLHEIINKLIKVRGESSLKISDECIFIQACTYERGEIANQNKNPKLMEKTSEKKEELPELATAKQIEYLYRLGVSNFNPVTLTKIGAKWLIEEALKYGESDRSNGINKK